MQDNLSLKEIKKEWHGSIKAYIVGFLLSLILTSLSFSLVVFNLLSKQTLLHTLGVLAIFQAMCQLIFFLHLGKEAKPRWESVIFVFMLLILLIIVIGTLWIMSDLNARMMPDMSNMGMHHD